MDDMESFLANLLLWLVGIMLVAVVFAGLITMIVQ